MSDLEKDNLFSMFLQTSETLETFVFERMDYYSRIHDYGDGQPVLTMIEMHTLSKIADTPGLCVTDIAKMWNRTLGAATKNINRLEKKGFVIKKKLPGNKKNVHLFATPEGERLAKLHAEYDAIENRASCNWLLERHSEDELVAFANVLNSLMILNKISK